MLQSAAYRRHVDRRRSQPQTSCGGAVQSAEHAQSQSQGYSYLFRDVQLEAALLHLNFAKFRKQYEP